MIKHAIRPRLPEAGLAPGLKRGVLEALSDADLATLNALLPWHAHVADGLGRRFGDAAWAGKRQEPQVIPDPRIVELDERFGLSDKVVLEVGCFEGIHTVALCNLAKRVVAIDSRVENVAKTLVRTAMFDCWPQVYAVDVEATPTDGWRLAADVAHHVGVLYHLRDPVGHLLDLGRHIAVGLMLDTHVARPDDVDAAYTAGGTEWRYQRKTEGGRADPFSGMYAHAKWLPLDELERLLAAAGFPVIDVAERRDERNGLRVKIFARRADG
jgi:tRNA (mo5U34)-methyltransferase